MFCIAGYALLQLPDFLVFIFRRTRRLYLQWQNHDARAITPASNQHIELEDINAGIEQGRNRNGREDDMGEIRNMDDLRNLERDIGRVELSNAEIRDTVQRCVESIEEEKVINHFKFLVLISIN